VGAVPFEDKLQADWTVIPL